MSTDIFELNCPFCNKLYKLPRDKVAKHAGKSIPCRKCGKPFSIPTLPPDEPEEQEPEALQELPPEPVVETVALPPEPQHPPPEAPPMAIPVEETTAPEPPLPPLDEHPGAIPFAMAQETFEPPPLSEYGQTPLPGIGFDEAPTDSPADSPPDHAEESFAAVDAHSLSQPFDTHFAAETIIKETVPAFEEPPEYDSPPASGFEAEVSESNWLDLPAATELEPPPIAEFDDIPPALPAHDETHEEAASAAESSFVEIAAPPIETRRTESASTPTPPVKKQSIEAPPPQLPPVPVAPRPAPLPPKPRRARTLVSPVFDAVPEEPQPRRRGRFGFRSDSEESDNIDQPPMRAAEAPLRLMPPVPTVIEAAPPEPEVEVQPIEPAESAIKSESEPEASEATSTTSFEEEELVPPPDMLPSAATMPANVSEDTLGDLKAIRRSVALLAIMSVILSMVLISILLALLGIIPKK